MASADLARCLCRPNGPRSMRESGGRRASCNLLLCVPGPWPLALALTSWPDQARLLSNAQIVRVC